MFGSAGQHAGGGKTGGQVIAVFDDAFEHAVGNILDAGLDLCFLPAQLTFQSRVHHLIGVNEEGVGEASSRGASIAGAMTKRKAALFYGDSDGSSERRFRFTARTRKTMTWGAGTSGSASEAEFLFPLGVPAGEREGENEVVVFAFAVHELLWPVCSLTVTR